MHSSWDISLYRAIHPDAVTSLTMVASWLAEIPLAIAILIVMYQVIRYRDWQTGTCTLIACSLVLGFEFFINLLAFQPRPFSVGFGPAWVSHAANNSMPSTHVAITWALAIVLALRHLRWLAAATSCLGLLMAWARIYVGIHWPVDMVGAALSALLASRLAFWTQPIIFKSLAAR